MLLTTRLKLTLQEPSNTALRGVKVSLYDRDEGDPDDYLATGVTDSEGEILFQFDSEQYTDVEDGPEWRLDSLPDLYIVIYDAQGNPVYTTRSEYLKHALPRRFEIAVPTAVARAHDLIA